MTVTGESRGDEAKADFRGFAQAEIAPLADRIDRDQRFPETLIGTLASRTAALPVVVAKSEPVEFWRWQPGAAMQRGFWNIPIPAERHAVTPDALLIPLVGYDSAGFRLGYGGGYYDRTLAALAPRPFCIGAGYDSAELATIHPQPHDIPMDLIVTERRVLRFARER